MNAELKRRFDVEGEYNKKTANLKLRVFGRNTVDTYELTAHSGGAYSDQDFNSDGSAIPNGEYYLVPDPNPTASNRVGNKWFGLFKADNNIDDYDMHEAAGSGPKLVASKTGLRLFGSGNFRLHLGTWSTGCITANTGAPGMINSYNKMSDAVSKSPLVDIPKGIGHSGTVKAYGMISVR